MSSTNVPVPGYGGYNRLYAREHVTYKDVPAHKYDGVANTSRGLMTANVYQSEYGTRSGPETIVTPGNGVALTASGSYPPIVTAVPVTLADGSAVAGFQGGATISGGPMARSMNYNTTNGGTSAAARSALRSAGHGSVYGTTVAESGVSQDHLAFVAQRTENEHKEAYQQRPEHVSNWSTTYSNTHDANRAFATHREVAARSADLSASTRLRGDPNLVLGAPTALLRATRATSGYAMDYGSHGSNPLERHIAADGKSSISKNATTRDLFLGTTKGSARIPGYSGHVPAQPRNINTVTGVPAPNVKDHLVFNYREHLPGYTGHRPSAAINDRLIRATREPGPKPVMKASLILDSMRVT